MLYLRSGHPANEISVDRSAGFTGVANEKADHVTRLNGKSDSSRSLKSLRDDVWRSVHTEQKSFAVSESNSNRYVRCEPCYDSLMIGLRSQSGYWPASVCDCRSRAVSQSDSRISHSIAVRLIRLGFPSSADSGILNSSLFNGSGANGGNSNCLPNSVKLMEDHQIRQTNSTKWVPLKAMKPTKLSADLHSTAFSELSQ